MFNVKSVLSECWRNNVNRAVAGFHCLGVKDHDYVNICHDTALYVCLLCLLFDVLVILLHIEQLKI